MARRHVQYNSNVSESRLTLLLALCFFFFDAFFFCKSYAEICTYRKVNRLPSSFSFSDFCASFLHQELQPSEQPALVKISRLETKYKFVQQVLRCYFLLLFFPVCQGMRTFSRLLYLLCNFFTEISR